MTTRFDLEQQIMNCWNVVEDIKTVYEHIGDSPEFEGMDPKHADMILNLLIGMEKLYQIKFEKMFDTFEVLVHNKELRNQTEPDVCDSCLRWQREVSRLGDLLVQIENMRAHKDMVKEMKQLASKWKEGSARDL